MDQADQLVPRSTFTIPKKELPEEIVARFRFLHAADLHIDSPLVGLARKSQDFASRVDDASRRAFDNLISLAIDEECAFIVIAGDIFDGQWRDYRTGLYFVDRMRRLENAGIKVYLIPVSYTH